MAQERENSHGGGHPVKHHLMKLTKSPKRPQKSALAFSSILIGQVVVKFDLALQRDTVTKKSGQPSGAEETSRCHESSRLSRNDPHCGSFLRRHYPPHREWGECIRVNGVSEWPSDM